MNLDVLICLPENLVAPLAGAWIEIVVKIAVELSPNVAPLAGAWIEINQSKMRLMMLLVAPLAGAWIEILYVCNVPYYNLSRSPRGSVD